MSVISLLSILAFGITSSSYAEKWYPGVGLKQGDYFRYNVCWIDYHNCSPLEIDFWVKNQTSDSTGWNLEFHVMDGTIIQNGMVTIGMIAPDPTYSDSNVFDYANVYNNTIAWLDLCTAKDFPRDFSQPAWCKRGSVNGQSIGPWNQVSVTVQGGTYNAWIIGWHKGVDNMIWVVPNLPFPVKAQVFTDEVMGPRLAYSFELLETENCLTEPQFSEYKILAGSNAQNPNCTKLGILSPRQQLANGILSENVVCQDGLMLIKRIHSVSVACVKPDTAQKLIERGWGTIISQIREQQFITKDNAIKVTIISADASSSSASYNSTEISKIQQLIDSCSNAQIFLSYGLGSETITLNSANNYCKVSISGEIEMGQFSNQCTVPIENMTNWKDWKGTNYPGSVDGISSFCQKRSIIN